MPGESLRHRLVRYGIVAAIVLIVGGIFVQREYLSADDDTVVEREGPLEIGAPAPDFELPLLDGSTFRLSDARGQVVVLNFWASWCAPCRFEMPEFQALYEERLPDGDLLVVGVNAAYDDSRSGAERFVDDFGVTFPTPLDESGAVAGRYGVIGLGLPFTFFIDADGILRARSLGPVWGDRLAESVEAAGG